MQLHSCSCGISALNLGFIFVFVLGCWLLGCLVAQHESFRFGAWLHDLDAPVLRLLSMMHTLSMGVDAHGQHVMHSSRSQWAEDLAPLLSCLRGTYPEFVRTFVHVCNQQQEKQETEQVGNGGEWGAACEALLQFVGHSPKRQYATNASVGISGENDDVADNDDDEDDDVLLLGETPEGRESQPPPAANHSDTADGGNDDDDDDDDDDGDDGGDGDDGEAAWARALDDFDVSDFIGAGACAAADQGAARALGTGARRSAGAIDVPRACAVYYVVHMWFEELMMSQSTEHMALAVAPLLMRFVAAPNAAGTGRDWATERSRGQERERGREVERSRGREVERSRGRERDVCACACVMHVIYTLIQTHHRAQHLRRIHRLAATLHCTRAVVAVAQRLTGHCTHPALLVVAAGTRARVRACVCVLVCVCLSLRLRKEHGAWAGVGRAKGAGKR